MAALFIDNVNASGLPNPRAVSLQDDGRVFVFNNAVITGKTPVNIGGVLVIVSPWAPDAGWTFLGGNTLRNPYDTTQTIGFIFAAIDASDAYHSYTYLFHS